MLQRASRFFNMVGWKVEPSKVDARVQVLAASSLFDRVIAGDLRVLATMFERRELGHGETICRSGDPARCMYAVVAGEIEVWLDAEALPVARMGPGDAVGEYGLFLSRGVRPPSARRATRRFWSSTTSASSASCSRSRIP